MYYQISIKANNVFVFFCLHENCSKCYRFLIVLFNCPCAISDNLENIKYCLNDYLIDYEKKNYILKHLRIVGQFDSNMIRSWFKLVLRV